MAAFYVSETRFLIRKKKKKNQALMHSQLYFCLCVGCSAIVFTFHTQTV